jgi:hypothetical protein
VDGRERMRRDDPERTGPVRSWSKLYHASDPREAADGAASADGAERDVVAQGVGLGYRVIEEQIRQGQRVAEQISAASYSPSAIGGDMREASERMVRYSADLLALWFDFVNSTMANGELMRNFSASLQGARPPAEATGPAAAASTSVAVELCSIRPVRVTLDLKAHAAGRSLATHGLRAADIDKPPLTEVGFERAADAAPLVLRLRVPETQPPGLYTGVVIDKQSGELLGTLTAQVSE